MAYIIRISTAMSGPSHPVHWFVTIPDISKFDVWSFSLTPNDAHIFSRKSEAERYLKKTIWRPGVPRAKEYKIINLKERSEE
jgi:hypothetical protein